MLCLKTGSVTAQYHVVFDDWFQTAEVTANRKVNFEHNNWHETFGLTKWQCVPSDKGLTPLTEALPDLEQCILNQQEAAWGVQDQQNPAHPLTDADLPSLSLPNRGSLLFRGRLSPKLSHSSPFPWWKLWKKNLWWRPCQKLHLVCTCLQFRGRQDQ